MVATPACTQTRESIDEFKEKCREYDLAEAEVLNIINTRPYNVVGIFPVCYTTLIDNLFLLRISLILVMIVMLLSLWFLFLDSGCVYYHVACCFMYWVYVITPYLQLIAFVFVPCIMGGIGTAFKWARDKN